VATTPGPGHAGSAYPHPGYPGHGGPYYRHGGYYGYGHYYGYPYYYGYPSYYGYGGFSFSVGVGLGYPYGYAYPYPYAYGGYPPYGYGYSQPSGYPGYVVAEPGRTSAGSVRIVVGQRDAEVFVDGYYVGAAGDFDGASGQLSLEPGPHRIELRLGGFEPVAFDVNVQPGQTVTYRTGLRPS